MKTSCNETSVPAISIGFTRQISERFLLDWGVQKSFILRESGRLGYGPRNYLPGAGSGQSDPFVGYLQGIVALKYHFQ